MTNNRSIQKSVSLSSSVEIIGETIATATPQQSQANSPRMTNSSGHSSTTKASSPRSSITKRTTASNNPSTSWINPKHASKSQRTKAAVKKHKPTGGFRGGRGSYGYMGYRGRGGGYYGRG